MDQERRAKAAAASARYYSAHRDEIRARRKVKDRADRSESARRAWARRKEEHGPSGLSVGALRARQLRDADAKDLTPWFVKFQTEHGIDRVAWWRAVLEHEGLL